jgi:hypothetical protein
VARLLLAANDDDDANAMNFSGVEIEEEKRGIALCLNLCLLG